MKDDLAEFDINEDDIAAGMEGQQNMDEMNIETTQFD